RTRPHRMIARHGVTPVSPSMLREGPTPYAKYNAARMFAASGSTYAKTQSLPAAEDMPSDIPGFRLNGRYYYWVAQENWTTPEATPFAMSCFKSRNALYCQTGYALRPG